MIQWEDNKTKTKAASYVSGQSIFKNIKNIKKEDFTVFLNAAMATERT